MKATILRKVMSVEYGRHVFIPLTESQTFHDTGDIRTFILGQPCTAGDEFLIVSHAWSVRLKLVPSDFSPTFMALHEEKPLKKYTEDWEPVG